MYIEQGPREDQKSRGSETSNLPKIYPSNPKINFLLHFHNTISKSQGGQLTPLTPGPVLARYLVQSELIYKSK